MSFQNKDFINEFLNNQAKQSEDVREVKRLGKHFQETEKARTAKQALQGEQLKDLRSKFSSFFVKSVEV